MKRSNLFLSLTTGLLAIASFAFAKSHAKGSIQTARCRTVANPTPAKCAAFVKFQNLQLVPSSIKEQCVANSHLGTYVTTAACAVTLIEQQD
jgi:hypothetical protein